MTPEELEQVETYHNGQSLQISKKLAESVSLLAKDVSYMKDSIRDINNKLDKLDGRYVTVDQFWPVKTIVYGGAGIVLTSVMGAILTVIIISRG